MMHKGNKTTMVESKIRYVINPGARANTPQLESSLLNPETLSKVHEFHQSFPVYEATPLHELPNLADALGIASIYVKDESFRFGLNAFKVLGGTYAIAKYIGNRLGLSPKEMTFEYLRSEAVRKRLGDVTFVTATDGNHGRGVAWAAAQLNQKSVVFMPKGSSEIRLENIRKEGAEASILDVNYDDAVRVANSYAQEHGGILIQDTAWEGYEDIPNWIMQGYATVIQETMAQLSGSGQPEPTHVFLQAGVGSFAGSILGYLVSRFGENRPVSVILEPENAACIYMSAKAGDGNPHAVTGDLCTIMAGLACGEPNTSSWSILRDYADMYVSCPDDVAALGMRVLGNPLPGDPPVCSGESGAVGIGFLKRIMEKDELKNIGDQLQLGTDSRVLIISTEGDTDPDQYRKIVWE